VASRLVARQEVDVDGVGAEMFAFIVGIEPEELFPFCHRERRVQCVQVGYLDVFIVFVVWIILTAWDAAVRAALFLN
jgi:hypothetical protein